jgi:hypothetical protein
MIKFGFDFIEKCYIPILKDLAPALNKRSKPCCLSKSLMKSVCYQIEIFAQLLILYYNTIKYLNTVSYCIIW